MRDTFPTTGTRRLETPEETQELAAELGLALEAGDVVILDGPVGAGKTTFTQGVARGMGVKGRVTSPTFIIAREHRSTHGGPALVHVDAYRLLDNDPAGNLDSLDLDTELANAVVVAEWGGGLVEQLAQRYLLVTIDRETAVREDPDSQARYISWQVVGTSKSKEESET